MKVKLRCLSKSQQAFKGYSVLLFDIWHFLRLQMEILFAVCVPETPSLFATVYGMLHFLSQSCY